MTAPFSEADVKLVADAAEGAPWPCEHSNPKSTDPCDWWTCPQCQATAVLAALAAAGRILPDGSETSEHWAVRRWSPAEGEAIGSPTSLRADAEWALTRIVEVMREHPTTFTDAGLVRREVRRWPDGAVMFGPWTTPEVKP